MLLKRTGFPEESDLVVCSVNNIQHNSIFVNIHEYNRQGMITISEIAPGRIRNIRDYVSEGKVVVCKVLNVNQERGYIDLSLRRVSEGQRRQKSDEIKQEQKAEKIIELTAKSLGIPNEGLYNTIADKLLKQYFYIFQGFDDIINGSLPLNTILDAKIAEALEKNIRDKIKPKDVAVAGDVSISIWEPNGVEMVRKTLTHVVNTYKVGIHYLGGGKYRILLKGIDYKTLEKTLKDSSDAILAAVKKAKGKAEYARVKNIIIAE